MAAVAAAARVDRVDHRHLSGHFGYVSPARVETAPRGQHHDPTPVEISRQADFGDAEAIQHRRVPQFATYRKATAS